jgi:hypothetical protein
MKIKHGVVGPTSTIRTGEFMANKIYWCAAFKNWYGTFGFNISSEKALNFLKFRRR